MNFDCRTNYIMDVHECCLWTLFHEAKSFPRWYPNFEFVLNLEFMPFVESSNLLTRRNVGVVLYHLYYKCIEYCSSYGIVGCCSCVCCPIKKGGRQCSLIRRTNKKCLFSCRRNRIYQQLSTTHSLTGVTARRCYLIKKDQGCYQCTFVRLWWWLLVFCKGRVTNWQSGQ